MAEVKRKSIRNSIGRMTFVVLCMAIQVGWLVFFMTKLSEYSSAITAVTYSLALILAFHVHGKNSNAAFKMPWIILILTIPILGICLYYFMGEGKVTRKKRRQFESINREIMKRLQQEPEVMKEVAKLDLGISNQFYYLLNSLGYPVYQNTDIDFYDDGADGFAAQLEAIARAKSFVFLEYHAIEEGECFLQMKEVLIERVKAGVEVRVFYDDVGSMGFINKDFIGRMERAGIQCRVFNPVAPFFNMLMNNRDHRKITVIDGKVGFTGGYNLADQYFNIGSPYGHWKDTGIRLEGGAVRSLTVMFLEMWNAGIEYDLDYDKYLPNVVYEAKEQGFVVPYGDSPLGSEQVGEDVYLNMIKQAKKEIFIATPYLIISDEMTREIAMAAKRGIDVRIMTPGIPDKKAVFQLTRSYYRSLVSQGVRVYEYTPGFLHQKQFLCDGELAVVGTINLDFRSLYLHFENAVLFYGYSAIADIRQDFLNIMAVSEEVTEEYRTGKSRAMRLGQRIMRLFAPLL